MDASILTSQYYQLKDKILFDLQEQIKKHIYERIQFTNIFFHTNLSNPDVSFSVYGLEKGSLLFDTFYEGSNLYIEDLSIEGLLHVRNEIDYYEKNKEISKSFSS
jgi:hypothetical protein